MTARGIKKAEKTEAAQPTEADTRTTARVVESLILRGDISALTPEERARFYVQLCDALGLNPSSQPFAMLRLNGKEVLYPTRGATDQLAAIHRLNREIIDGPRVIDLAGTKLVYAVCRATHPNGRIETAVATVPLTDPVNVLMKAETKAKRRATLSILGMGMLDESEIETIPAHARSPSPGVDLSVLAPASVDAPANDNSVSGDTATVAAPEELSPALGSFQSDLSVIELPGEAVLVWIRHRAALATLSPAEREAAWKALCDKTEQVGRMKNAKVWLKRAIAQEDAGRSAGSSVVPEEPVAER